ncbi:MAG: hypothetical protein K0U40_04525 [Betaproteobacteria bacterium]|nr:hypothetical protein [Betaproteobacteria bacterium]
MIPTDIYDPPTPLSTRKSSKLSIKGLQQLDSQTHGLIRDANQGYVFFVENDNRFLRVPVELGYVIQKVRPIYRTSSQTKHSNR